jgi:hypothetical protein
LTLTPEVIDPEGDESEEEVLDEQNEKFAALAAERESQDCFRGSLCLLCRWPIAFIQRGLATIYFCLTGRRLSNLLNSNGWQLLNFSPLTRCPAIMPA